MTTTVAIETLGCSKNSVDSEAIISYLVAGGWSLVEDLRRAEVIIVNTCGFITPAKEESINTILELALLKETGNCKKLVVTGCMAGKYATELSREIPEIDLVVDNNDAAELYTVLTGKLLTTTETMRQVPLDTVHTRYLKISEGCNNKCTYCTIPQLKGEYRSRTMESILVEAEYLVSQGAKELVLIAQDTTRYGTDLYGEKRLAQLVVQLTKIEDLRWLRLLYCYPSQFTPELIELIANHPKVCNYVDIPLQHVSDKVLGLMGRHSSKSAIVQLIDTLRGAAADIAIRSTFIVGFPGETEEDFKELLQFLTDSKLNWVGAFTYWPEPDTAAAEFTHQIDQRVKEERAAKLMEVQRRITASNNQKLIDKEFDVLIEGISAEYPEYKVGRLQYQAPEVDGSVYLRTAAVAGDMVSVKLTEVWDDYDLLGVDVGEFGK